MKGILTDNGESCNGAEDGFLGRATVGNSNSVGCLSELCASFELVAQ